MKTIKIIFPFLFISIISACSQVKYLDDTSKSDKTEMKVYLKEMKAAILSHDKSELMKIMDADYVKEQHDQFLEGRTEQFLNEVFCGNDINDESFHCIRYESIESVKIKMVEQVQPLVYKLLLEVKDDENEVECQLLISKKSLDSQTIFGIVGAVG